MALSQNKILLLVEGEDDEPNLLNKMIECYFPNGMSENFDIVPFKTNIYVLYKKLKN